MMGLTPMDIHNKEFERAFRGYLVEEVNEFRSGGQGNGAAPAENMELASRFTSSMRS